MKIAVYYPWIHLKSGVERTILETLKRSKHQYTVFTNHYNKKGTYPEFKDFKVIELRKIPVRRNLFSVIRAAVIIIFQKINLAGFDFLLVHSDGLGDLVLVRNNKIPAICFCHTPLRPVFDIDYKERVFMKKNLFEKIVYFVFAYIFKVVDRFLWQKYKYVFLNSKETLTRAKIGNLVGNNTKCQVLHPGVDWKGTKPTNKFDKYFLVPGRIMWTKNIELAIDSFNRFQEITKGEEGFELVIAGQVDHKSKGYFEFLKSLSGKNKGIEFVTNPSEEKMKKLYANCFLVLCTSFNEDWGVVAIEANSFGKPVIALNKGGYLESQINGVTGYLLRADPVAFGEKMRLLTNDRKFNKTMGDSARENSKQYDWIRFIKSFDSTIFRLGRGNNY